MTLAAKLDAARMGRIEVMSSEDVAAYDRKQEMARGGRRDIEMKNAVDATDVCGREERARQFRARGVQRGQDVRVARHDQEIHTELQRLGNTMQAKLERRREGELAAKRQQARAQLVLECMAVASSAAAFASCLLQRRVLEERAHRLRAARVVVRFLRSTLLGKAQDRAADVLVMFLRARIASLFGLLRCRQHIRCTVLAQARWRGKLARTAWRAQQLFHVWQRADAHRIESSVLALAQRDKLWVKRENDKIVHFNAHHTGRVAGARKIERMDRCEPYSETVLRRQVPYFTQQSSHETLPLRAMLLRREARYRRYEREKSVELWPMFVQAVRDDNFGLSRAEVQAICVRMRDQGQMLSFLSRVSHESDGDGLPGPFNGDPDLGEMHQLVAEAAQVLKPELGPRVSLLPKWYLDDRKKEFQTGASDGNNSQSRTRRLSHRPRRRSSARRSSSVIQ